jgi:hypothetical protein
LQGRPSGRFLFLGWQLDPQISSGFEGTMSCTT